LNRQVFKSLRFQLFCAILISFVVGAVIFFAAFFLGNEFLDRTVYSHPIAQQQADQQFEKLQSYVKNESISVDNLNKLNIWCNYREKVYLVIYEDNDLIYESPYSGDVKNKPTVPEFGDDIEDLENEYTLTLHGNVEVRAFLYYYTGEIFYLWILILSGFFAFISFSLCFIALINRKVTYIKHLKRELDILSGGQLEYAVTINGNDEIGDLAAGIDQMRRSIMSHQEIENQMRSANSELITAVSHDLRTPLTSLLAYLEIIERKKFSDEEQMYELIHKSIGQTLRIKNMADKLFEYFLVYATEWESAETETADADSLFGQILEDYAYSLENSGIAVEREFAQVSGEIRVNMELLQRALDNIYSNLLKYADPNYPIRFSYKREGDLFSLVISNRINPNREHNESTNIGLGTCKRIIEYHDGTFTVDENDGEFTVSVTLPITK